MRIVIDTNIWISFLIGKSLAGLSDAILSDRVTLLFSEELFAEMIDVLQRPKFKNYFSTAAIEELIVLLYERVVHGLMSPIILTIAAIKKIIFYWIYQYQGKPII